MSRRNVMNERYKKENAGTTRKSAASVKPKREAGESSTTSKPKAKKGPSRTPARKSASVRVPDSPEIKRLRKYWWGFMGTALLLAVLLVPITQNKATSQRWGGLAVGVYTVALAGALYLEFGPIRKARAAAVAAAKKDEKGGKSKGAKKPVPVVAVTPTSAWKPSWWPFGTSSDSQVDAGSPGKPKPSKPDEPKPGKPGEPGRDDSSDV